MRPAGSASRIVTGKSVAWWGCTRLNGVNGRKVKKFWGEWWVENAGCAKAGQILEGAVRQLKKITGACEVGSEKDTSQSASEVGRKLPNCKAVVKRGRESYKRGERMRDRKASTKGRKRGCSKKNFKFPLSTDANECREGRKMPPSRGENSKKKKKKKKKRKKKEKEVKSNAIAYRGRMPSRPGGREGTNSGKISC